MLPGCSVKVRFFLKACWPRGELPPDELVWPLFSSSTVTSPFPSSSGTGWSLSARVAFCWFSFFHELTAHLPGTREARELVGTWSQEQVGVDRTVPIRSHCKVSLCSGDQGLCLFWCIILCERHAKSQKKSTKNQRIGWTQCCNTYRKLKTTGLRLGTVNSNINRRKMVFTAQGRMNLYLLTELLWQKLLFFSLHLVCSG